MVKCVTTLVHASAEALCSSGWSLCTKAEWVDYGGAGGNYYWLYDDNWDHTAPCGGSCGNAGLKTVGGDGCVVTSGTFRNWGSCVTCEYMSTINCPDLANGAVCCRD